jgi:hypothetical protein
MKGERKCTVLAGNKGTTKEEGKMKVQEIIYSHN